MGWYLWKVIDYKDGALMNGISALIREILGVPLPLPSCEDTKKKKKKGVIQEPGSDSSPTSKSAVAFILDYPSSEL